MRRTPRLPLFALVATVALALPVLGDDAEEARYGGENVRIRLTVGQIDDGKPTGSKSYEMLARDGSLTKLMTGWRVPFPTTTFNTASNKDGAIVPVTSFTYQNVGMTTQLRVHLLDNGRVHLEGDVEVSAVDQALQGSNQPNAPKIGTFDHAFNVTLPQGRSNRVALIPKPEGGSMFLDIATEIVR